MSFHRRYYNWENICYFGKTNNFQEFNDYILKPNSRVSEDEKTLRFINLYCRKSKKRKILYDYLHSPTRFKNIKLALILKFTKIK